MHQAENPGMGGCKTAVNTCTLRAAIEESNASAGVTDTIKFDFASFNGQIAGTIKSEMTQAELEKVESSELDEWWGGL